MKKEILKLRNQGKSYRDIEKLLNCSKGTIAYHCSPSQILKRKEYGEKRRERNKKWIEQVKNNLKCKICGENRNWVLDFHHIDSSKKERCVASLILRTSKEKVLEEIKKCEVLCSNCHRDFHYKNGK